MSPPGRATPSGVGIVTVRDEEAGLAFSVTPKSGGGLSGLQFRRNHRWLELLHRANPFQPASGAWCGGAPWLFPAVGRSSSGGRPDCYAFNGTLYPMPIHGLVMNRAWTLISSSKKSVACRTSSDAVTRKSYPFDFELTAEYALLPDGLSVRAEVLASSSNPGRMPFCLGNHLTLAIPFDGEDAGEHIVRTPATTSLSLSPQGFLTGESRPVSLAAGATLREDPRLTDMVLDGFPPGECWIEVRAPSGLGLRVRQSVETEPGPLRFVLFAAPPTTFLCPEPWCGEPNSLNTGRALSWLRPGERFEWEMEISIL